MDLNMNQNSISRYETGEREADYATLIKFADYFHVSVDYLLEHSDEPKPYPKKKLWTDRLFDRDEHAAHMRRFIIQFVSIHKTKQ